MYADRHIGQVN